VSTKSLSPSVPVSCPVLTLRATRAQTFVGDIVEFHCEALKGSPPILYQLYHEDVILGSISATSIEGASFNLSLTEKHSGIYFCEANNGQGAQRSYTMTLSVRGRFFLQLAAQGIDLLLITCSRQSWSCFHKATCCVTSWKPLVYTASI
jgi:hypothetical protein